LALYAENQVQWNPKLLTNIGVRTTGFSLKDKTYFSFEPRLTAQYKLNRSLSFNSGFSIMSQYMHLITSSTLSLPTDIWLPVNDKIKPIRSYQYNLGSILNLGSDFSLDTEIYYKSTKNILEFSDKYYTGDGTPSWDEQVESGKSWSTGFELMLRKDKGKTQGHLVYTLAKSMVNYNQLNHGRTFASPYDRRHDLSMQLSRKLNSKLDITLNWVYGSGLPVTLPSQVIKSISPYNPQSLGQVPIFSERNAIRMPEYHRLDLSLNFKKKKRHGTRIWNIGIYNVYNRKNASFVYMTQDYNYDGTSMFSLRQLSLFGFIPSFSYSYQF